MAFLFLHGGAPETPGPRESVITPATEIPSDAPAVRGWRGAWDRVLRLFGLRRGA